MIELLGLPGVGKTTTCTSFENFVQIQLGKSFNKIQNLFYVFWRFNSMVRKLLILYITHSIIYFKIIKARPYIVLLERLGRFLNHSGTIPLKTTVFDEGAYQFLWRIFSEIPMSKNRRSEMSILINLINTKLDVASIIYVHTSKEKLVERIILRNKIASNFDRAVIRKNRKKFNLGRHWMFYLIVELRRKEKIKDVIWNK